MSDTFIMNKWGQTRARLDQAIKNYNSLDLPTMQMALDDAKKALREFLEVLREQKEPVRAVFKDNQEMYITEIEKMAKGIENTKHNMKQPKKEQIKEGGGGKDNFQASLNQAIVREKPNVKWTDIAGLEMAKQALHQAVILPIRFPEMFTGSRKPWKGILLYGPPGTGKTYLAKACATEMEKGTFFSISSSDIMSKYVGESEKIIKTLFQMARKEKPAIIFIDEVDSMVGNRSDGQNQASRRVKTEFLVQMQGVGNDDQGILVLGATNLPWALDPAIRRRFEKRIYIPLPDEKARVTLFKNLLKETPNCLDEVDFAQLGKITNNYSGSDISTLVRDAAYEPLRICQSAIKFRMAKNEKSEDAWTPVPPSENFPGQKYVQCSMQQLNGKIHLPDLQFQHFVSAMMRSKPSVSKDDLHRYVEFTKSFGMDGSQ